jgi:hypothetical protein
MGLNYLKAITVTKWLYHVLGGGGWRLLFLIEKSFSFEPPATPAKRPQNGNPKQLGTCVYRIPFIVICAKLQQTQREFII